MKQQITPRIEKDLYKKLKIYCIENGITLESFVEKLIIKELKEKE